MRRPVRVPLAEAGVWLALAGAAYVLTFEFQQPLEVYRYGASGWPRALILLMGVDRELRLRDRSPLR